MTDGPLLNYVAQPDKLAYAPDAGPTWLRPCGFVRDAGAGAQPCHQLAGGWSFFTLIDVVIATDEGGYQAWRTTPEAYHAASADKDAAEGALHRLTSPRPDFAALSLSRPHLMGIVNVTPDSFSDGGVHLAEDDALAGGRLMAAQGASILDIGGESTRPGAAPVPHDEEIRRITPVISQLTDEGVLVSADTRHPQVMQAALDAGAPIINDVSGFEAEGAAALMGAAHQRRPGTVWAVAMHMKGTPQTMQADPRYGFAPIEVFEVLKGHVERLEAAGLPRHQIAIDPGFGFGKTPQHNRQLTDWTAMFHLLGVPVLVGISRKSSIPRLAAASALGAPDDGYGDEASDRLGGTLALTLEAVRQGAQLVRTHDIPQTRQAIAIELG